MWVVEDENGNQSFIPFSSGDRILVNDPINEFLGTVSNLWSNPLNWSLGFLPTANQTAIIQAECVLDVAGNVKKLNIGSGVILSMPTVSSLTAANIKNLGVINVSGPNNSLTISMAGVEDVFGSINFINATNGLVLNTIEDIALPSLDYGTLRLDGSFTKSLQSNLLIRGSLTSSQMFNLNGFNFEQLGSSVNSIVSSGLTTVSNEHVIFNSLLTSVTSGCFSLSGSPIIEIRNGLSHGGGGQVASNWGQSTFKFSNNDQTITGSAGMLYYNLLVGSGITLTANVSNAGGLRVTNDLNGENALSTYRNVTITSIEFEHIPMRTGKFYTSVIGNVVIYNRAGNQDIRVPDEEAYRELRLQGSGAKRLTGNTTCDHLYFSGAVTLDLNGYNLTGYTKYTDIRSQNTTLPFGSFEEFTIGNNTKTLSGNLSIGSFFQTSSVVLALSGFTITATNFFNRNSGTTQIATATVSATNWYYDNTGNQSVAAGTYKNLTLSGSGIKTLQGNVIVTGTYQRIGTATLNKNGFTIKDSSGNDLE